MSLKCFADGFWTKLSSKKKIIFMLNLQARPPTPFSTTANKQV